MVTNGETMGGGNIRQPAHQGGQGREGDSERGSGELPAGGHVEAAPVVGSQSPQSRNCKKGNKQSMMRKR